MSSKSSVKPTPKLSEVEALLQLLEMRDWVYTEVGDGPQPETLQDHSRYVTTKDSVFAVLI
jgi:hypothetical protein